MTSETPGFTAITIRARMASWCSFPSQCPAAENQGGLIAALIHLMTLGKSPVLQALSPSSTGRAVRLALSIQQAVRRVEHREGVGRAPWELQYHLEILPGVPSWSHRGI